MSQACPSSHRVAIPLLSAVSSPAGRVPGSASLRHSAGAGQRQVSAGAGQRQVSAGAGQRQVSAGAGQRQVSAGAGQRQVSAGAGQRQVSAGAGQRQVSAGAGQRQVSCLQQVLLHAPGALQAAESLSFIVLQGCIGALLPKQLPMSRAHAGKIQVAHSCVVRGSTQLSSLPPSANSSLPVKQQPGRLDAWGYRLGRVRCEVVLGR